MGKGPKKRSQSWSPWQYAEKGYRLSKRLKCSADPKKAQGDLRSPCMGFGNNTGVRRLRWSHHRYEVGST